MDNVKISIIEDSAIHREWLQTELIHHAFFTLVSVDNLGRSGIASAKRYEPELILLDFQLQDMTGLEVAKRIKTHHENTKIFMLTAHTEPSIIARIVTHPSIDAIAIKGSPYFQINLFPALEHVVAGGSYLDPSLLHYLRKNDTLKMGALTRREFEIFIQANSGKTDEKIASDLCIELSHVRNIKSKITKKINKDMIKNIALKLMNNAHC